MILLKLLIIKAFYNNKLMFIICNKIQRNSFILNLTSKINKKLVIKINFKEKENKYFFIVINI